MNVVFFNRSYWPDVTATGQLLTELAEDLVGRHGAMVTVVTGVPSHWPSPLPSREVRNGVTIIRARGTRFDKRRFLGRAANYLSYFLSACLAAWRVPAGGVVVAMTDPPIIGLAGLLAAWRARARFVFYCNDVFPEVAVLLEDFRSETVNALLDRVNRFLLRRADAVVALGDTMRQRLIEKGADPRRTLVIPTWADVDAFRPEARAESFRREHGLEGQCLVMHAGNIGLSQNLDVVLDAAERLRDRTDCTIVFVGDGAKRPALEASARARGLAHVRFIPFLPRERMHESYAAADIFLVSLRPGLAGFIVPSKLYGILAAGRPYVAAVEDACEVAPLTREQACGLVVPPGDAGALADAIRTLAGDAAARQRMGTAARAASLAFDRPVVTTRWASELARLTAGPDA